MGQRLFFYGTSHYLEASHVLPSKHCVIVADYLQSSLEYLRINFYLTFLKVVLDPLI